MRFIPPGSDGNHHEYGDFEQLMDALHGMPFNKQLPLIFQLIADVVKHKSKDELLELRQLTITEMDQDKIPFYESVLDLVDGQLALRQIAGDEGWR